MSDKIKLSELFKKLMINSQFAMASEDNQLIKRLTENGDLKDKMIFLQETPMINEYLRISFIKTTVITLAELDFIEKDCDILDVNVSNNLVKESMEMFKKLKNK
jgi:hypothetical protein